MDDILRTVDDLESKILQYIPSKSESSHLINIIAKLRSLLHADYNSPSSDHAGKLIGMVPCIDIDIESFLDQALIIPGHPTNDQEAEEPRQSSLEMKVLIDDNMMWVIL